MAQLLFANNANATLAGPISPSAVTATLAAGTGAEFPNPGTGQFFKLTFVDAETQLEYEICNVTQRVGDVVTIQRGQEGTAAQTWAAGDFASNLITRDSLTAFAQSSLLSSNFYQGLDVGSANAVVVNTTAPTNTSPVADQVFLIQKGGNGNTGTVTAQITGGTACAVLYPDGTALQDNDWPAGAQALLTFTGAVFQFVACAKNSAVNTYFANDSGTADACVVNPNPPCPGLSTQLEVHFIKGANFNLTTTPTLEVSGLTAKPIVRCDGSACQPRDLPSGVLIPVQYDGASYRLLWSVTPTQIPIITINPTLYVRTDGNDNNSGLTNTAAGAFLTIAAALAHGTAAYNFTSSTLVIQLGNTGTYAAPTIVPVGSGTITIQGDYANQDNYVIAGVGVLNGGVISCQSTVVFGGVQIRNLSNQCDTVVAGAGAVVNLFNVTLLATQPSSTYWHAGAVGGSVQFSGGVKISGSYGGWIRAVTLGNATIFADVTFISTPAWGGEGVYCELLGSITFQTTFVVSGTATGKKYLMDTNSVGQNFSSTALPGNSAGTVQNGGIFQGTS